MRCPLCGNDFGGVPETMRCLAHPGDRLILSTKQYQCHLIPISYLSLSTGIILTMILEEARFCILSAHKTARCGKFKPYQTVGYLV